MEGSCDKGALIEHKIKICEMWPDGFLSCKALNEQYLQLTCEKDAHITKTETAVREHESELQQLKYEASR